MSFRDLIDEACCREEDCPIEEVHAPHDRLRWITCPGCAGLGFQNAESKSPWDPKPVCCFCSGKGQLHRRTLRG